MAASPTKRGKRTQVAPMGIIGAAFPGGAAGRRDPAGPCRRPGPPPGPGTAATWTRRPRGAQRSGPWWGRRPMRQSTGTPRAAARWTGPVLGPATAAQAPSRPMRPRRSAGGQRAVPGRRKHQGAPTGRRQRPAWPGPTRPGMGRPRTRCRAAPAPSAGRPSGPRSPRPRARSASERGSSGATGAPPWQPQGDRKSRAFIDSWRPVAVAAAPEHVAGLPDLPAPGTGHPHRHAGLPGGGDDLRIPVRQVEHRVELLPFQ